MISKNALIFICVSFIFTSRLFGQTMAPDLGSLNLSLNNEASLNSRPLSAKEEEALRLSLEFNSRPLKPIKGVDGKIMYVYGSSLPLVIGSPMNISDIEFEKGESVNEILVGDSFRWLIESGSSGDGITHVFVKPLDSGLETSLVVTTNRRVYHIQLVSRQTGFTPYIGFLYSSQLEPIVRKEAKEKEDRKSVV